MQATKTEMRIVRTVNEFNWNDIKAALITSLNQTGFEDLSCVRFEWGVVIETGDLIIKAIHDDCLEKSPILFPSKEQSGRELWCKVMGAKNGITYSSSNLTEQEVYESLRNQGWHWSASRARWIDTN